MGPWAFQGVLWEPFNLLFLRITRNHFWVLEDCTTFTLIQLFSQQPQALLIQSHPCQLLKTFPLLL